MIKIELDTFYILYRNIFFNIDLCTEEAALYDILYDMKLLHSLNNRSDLMFRNIKMDIYNHLDKKGSYLFV